MSRINSKGKRPKMSMSFKTNRPQKQLSYKTIRPEMLLSFKSERLWGRNVFQKYLDKMG